MINLTAKFVELYHTLKELLRETKVQVLWLVNHQIDGTAHAFAIKYKEPTYLGQIVLCLC